MLEVNPGLRRRFSTVMEFYSYTPSDLIALPRGPGEVPRFPGGQIVVW